MEEAEPYGVWLGRQLRRRGVSQAELAKDLDVTRAAVSAWITGRAEPRMDKIELIEHRLGLSSGSSFSRSEPLDSAEQLQWYHRPAHEDGGRELGNVAAQAFEPDLRILAREATQNSLDERVDAGRPVRVRYVVHEITGERLRRFLEHLRWQDVEPHLSASADRSRKAGRVIADGLQELRERDSLVLLRVDDYNASGLTGPEYGDGRFAAVVRRQLDSHKGATAGGSFGLGKATLWAAGRFGLVLMHSTLSEPHEGRQERRLIGRLDLPWHETNDHAYAGPAWLGIPDPSTGGTTRSWWGDDETVRELYLDRHSSDPGTSFLVVGAHDAASDRTGPEAIHDALVRGVADNFWASLTAGEGQEPMLEAHVETWRDGQVVRESERVDPHRHQPSRTRAMQAFLEGRTTERMTGSDDVVRAEVPLTVPALAGQRGSLEHRAVLLVTPTASEEEERPDRLVCMRGNRMVVTERPVRGTSPDAPSYQAVLLAGLAVGGSEADEAAERFLRAAEPPDHNDWRQTEDLVATYSRGASTRLREFRSAMSERVRAVLRPADQESGGTPEPLRDLLGLDASSPRPRPGHPTVKSATGEVGADGAWHVRATVGLPEREDPWIMRPLLKFATLSGKSLPAEWETLEPVSACRVEAGVLVFAPGVRSATFRGVSKVDSHPVAADRAVAEVDLQRGEDRK